METTENTEKILKVLKFAGYLVYSVIKKYFSVSVVCFSEFND